MGQPQTTHDDGPQAFIGYLQRARAVAWNPSAEWLARQSGIPKSTVETLINGRRKRLPDWSEQVFPLLEAYRLKVRDEGRGDPDALLGSMPAWKRAYDDAQLHRPLTCPLPTSSPAGQPVQPGPGRPLGEARPLDLEVHPAIDAGAKAAGLGELPTYIRRPHDEALALVVDQVRTEAASRILMLVGGSSTGKTRALWEAVRGLGEPWRLWHPINPGRPEAALAELESISAHTVVWLNEAQHYLLTPGPEGEQIAAGLRELLRTPERGPVLMVGTLWPEYWNILTTIPEPEKPDLHSQARELLKDVTVALPDTFDNLHVVARTGAISRDPRLAEALRRASDGALTQYLAGGPALIERYEKASTAAQAVLHAAMDARRLGHGPALPRLLLEQAAAGYLNDQQWDLLADDWLERAFAYLTDPMSCRGARAPLTRIRARPGGSPAKEQQDGEPSYRLADYLEQHGSYTRRTLCPPATFWDAATRHAAATDDHIALAQAAGQRFRYRHAFSLWQRAADAGDTEVLGILALLRERTGDHEGAERLARAATEAGDTGVLKELAESRERAGDHEEAERLACAAAEVGNTSALRSLAEWREQAGDYERAERLIRAAMNAGNIGVLGDLARLRERVGDLEEAERLYRAAADAGETYALEYLAGLRDDAGDYEGAERLARAAADGGKTYALMELAESRERAGDQQGAERLAYAAAEAGNTSALRDLARHRERAGDHQGAERLAYAAAEAGNTSALRDLARHRERAGDHQGAERLAYAAAEAGNTSALRALAESREQAGDQEEAERLARAAADAGNPGALGSLARHRERAGDREEAERLAYAAVGIGDIYTLEDLAESRERAGDHQEAERLARAATDAGNTRALWSLARLREHAGDHQGAERLARAAADAGDPSVLQNLSRYRERVGDREKAERLMRAAADAGDPSALARLSRQREQAGEHVEAERLAHAAADAGNTSALTALAESREQAGDLEKAERLARAATDAGDSSALEALSKRRKAAGGLGRWGDLLQFGLEADGVIAHPW
ncbi:hypothetical protein OG589_32790 [Sphaerisporangium sp. NBC_01403]|uniref:hypothetical protein n=1 Tax=Sphaerisporangium sp. NBC_01403 TaxID=2903599 RepID=UPI00325554C3